jgi:glycosyltransferase involved in cell wall biosynthesis
MESPLFSILIANYNNGRFFQDCYDSIVSQNYTNWEVVIVDDCSTDDSVMLIINLIGSDSRFKFFENTENRGCGYTKNRCSDVASGEICGFLDPDDALTVDAIELMVLEHEKNPKASMVYSNLLYCDEYLNFHHENKSRPVQNSDHLFFDFDGSISAFLSFKKSSYNLTDGINSYLLRAVDRDLVLKLYEVGTAIFLNKGLYKYRIHPNGISTNGNQDRAYFWYWVTVIDAAKRRNLNIEELFVGKALSSRREFYLQREIDSYNRSFIFKFFRKLGFFKII